MRADPTPSLDVRDGDVFLGEEIVFKRGLSCAARVPAVELWGRSCRLVIRGPDGLVSVHAREPSGYNGPSSIESLGHLECLNDLAVPLAPGAYELAYECEGREARRRIHVREHATPGPVVAVDFPEWIETEPGRPFAVRLELANTSGAPLRLVEPNSCYAASVVGFVSADDPPSWSRLDRTAERAGAQEARYRARVDVGSLGALTMVELAPGERRSYVVVFDEVFRASTGARWRPRERFDVTVGLVVHTFEPPMARPIHWLRRATGGYLATGARLSAGEARCKAWEWVNLSPSCA
jgi:hypothetical protein